MTWRFIPALILGILVCANPASALWEIFRNNVADYADALSSSLRGFDTQVSATLDSYDDAAIAWSFAAQINFAINDTETRAFVSKWKVAAAEARRLESEAQELHDEVKAFVNYVDKEVSLISDNKIREMMSRDLATRKLELSRMMATVAEGMKELRAAVQAGDDLVRAVEIQTALSIIDSKLLEAAHLTRAALNHAATLRLIGQDGLRILDEMRLIQGNVASK